jgi:hypothetical protein
VCVCPRFIGSVAGLSLLKPLLLLLWGFRRYLRRKARVFLSGNRWCPDRIFGAGGALGYKLVIVHCGLLDRETVELITKHADTGFISIKTILYTHCPLYRNTAVAASSFTSSRSS